MRDIGFNFYWKDKFTPNLVSKGFEYREETGDIRLITSFESFEHFVNPIQEIESMLSMSKNLLFTTELLPTPVPHPGDWHYYGLQHGQHVSFYSRKTLKFIADKYGLIFYSVEPLHLITSTKINPLYLKILLKCRRFGLFLYIKKRLKSRTVDDSILMKAKEFGDV